ncbi:uncharacterized protein TRIADDRAFT_61684 [Trichoplax adhaerens]|uniref:G-protein coupled receptors family 1 profile domain-containing protein n=1 Tax=Trichoplax adhaerens TaxID=10228 RepID=B3SBP0_TRIAD|nr:hypothetical protein TRIADDRAFT_61684 [Trichoplax adhaerens]EDV19917.1 hypothetical protein TRIADDRAFT_61684 [Trichoplax adhaerens]|eukprot:XP_002117659.1 hypothetical protein TRIADDRAFT_61684 [Trichoplax adhaerens]
MLNKQASEGLSTLDYLCCYVGRSVTICQPLPDQFSLSTCSDILSHGVLRVFIWLIGVLSIIGNIVSIIWHTNGKNKDYIIVRSLIINLSTADLLMGIYLTTIASANIYFSGVYAEYHEVWLRSTVCSICSFLVSISTFVSTLVIFLITLDRYLYLVYPFQNYRLSYRQIFNIFLIVWAISAVFTGLPIIYGFNQTPNNRLHSVNGACLPGNISNPYLLLWLLCYCGVTFLAWAIISIMYSGIIITLAKSRREANVQISRLDKIIVAKMITIVATDLICWLPFYAILIIGLINSELDTHVLPFIAVLSLPLNSCINPIIYTMFTQTFLDRSIRIVRSLGNCCDKVKWASSKDLLQDRSYYQIGNQKTKCLEKISIARTAAADFVSSNYFKVKLIYQSNKESTTAWLKYYSEKEAGDWKKEKQFYCHIKLQEMRVENILQCLWALERPKFKIESHRFKIPAKLQSKRQTGIVP